MVYVDRLCGCKPTARWPYHSVCHLTADSELELNEFALKIGLMMNWRQRSRRGEWHYDLTPNKRAQALREGAKMKL